MLKISFQELFLKVCLKLFAEAEVWMFLSKSFQILDSKYEIDFLNNFSWWIGSGKLSTDVLVLTTTSDIYAGEKLFLDMQIVVTMHGSALFVTGSQLIFSKWFSPLLFFLSILRQNLMQAFWAVCKWFFLNVCRF